MLAVFARVTCLGGYHVEPIAQPLVYADRPAHAQQRVDLVVPPFAAETASKLRRPADSYPSTRGIIVSGHIAGVLARCALHSFAR